MPGLDRLAVDFIGQPLDDYPEPEPGLIEWSEAMGKKAKTNGVYTLNGHRFNMRAGQILPDGAEFDETPDEVEEPEVEERAEKKAPENRAKKAAPENRDK